MKGYKMDEPATVQQCKLDGAPDVHEHWALLLLTSKCFEAIIAWKCRVIAQRASFRATIRVCVVQSGLQRRVTSASAQPFRSRS